MRDYFLKLFAHEHWGNAQVIAALKPLAKVPPRTEELLAHIISTHRFWELRVTGQPIPEYNFWHLRSVEQCEKLNDEYAGKWAAYIRAVPEPFAEQTLSFTAMDGTPRTFRIADFLTQLHLHSVHHRAQIILDMKAASLDPVDTDYLTYCRLHS